MRFGERSFWQAAAPCAVSVLLLLSSCASLQTDKLVSSADSQAGAELAALEAAIVPLDTAPDRQVILDTRKKITSLETSGVKDAVYEARLAAWSGRLFLIEGNVSEADRRLRVSVSLLAGDVFSSVLSARLVSDPGRRLELIASALLYTDEKGPLLIEQARALSAVNRYQEAAAAYDQAFLLLPPYYESVYRAERDAAWQLRTVNDDLPLDQLAIISKERLSWRDVLLLTQSETGLLNYLTAGKTWSAEQLQTRLIQDRVLLSEVAGNNLERSADRAGLAYFFWRLTAQKRSDPALLDAYSRRIMRMPSPASPIPDVSINDMWFDSVMGCIENEIMALPDGRNFNPAGFVRGTDFLQMLKKIR